VDLSTQAGAQVLSLNRRSDENDCFIVSLKILRLATVSVNGLWSLEAGLPGIVNTIVRFDLS